MAKIKRQTGPTVKASLLGQNLQSINVPRDAFGENVGQAVEGLGATGERSASRIAPILARRQDRREEAEAAGRAGEEKLRVFQDLEARKAAATKDPSLLSTFTQDYIAASNKSINEIANKMSSKEAALKFKSKMLASNLDMQKNSIRFQGQREIAVGQENFNFDLNSEILIGIKDLGNLASHRQNLVGIINDAGAARFITPEDMPDKVQDSFNRLDNGIVQSLMLDNPAALQEMIETDQLSWLTDKEENTAKKDIIQSFKKLDERAAYSEVLATLAKNPELSTKALTGSMTLGEVNSLEKTGVISTKAAKVWKDTLIAPETKASKVSDTLKDARQASLLAEFSTTLQEDIASKDIDSVAKLNKVLAFSEKVFESQDEGLFVGRKKMFETWMQDLIPSVTGMVDSKYLDAQAAGTSGLPLGVPGLFGGAGFDTGIKVFGRPKNVFAENYVAALDIFETTAPDFFLVKTNQVEVMSKTLSLLKESGSIEDLTKRKEFVRNIPQMAVTELLQELNPNGNFDNLNQIITGVNLQAAPANINISPKMVEALIANPEERDDFDKRFGPGAAERILGK